MMFMGHCILGRPNFGRKVFATIFWNDWVKSEIGTQGNHSIQSLSVPAGAPNNWNIGILALKPEFQPSCRNRKCMNLAFSFWLSNFIPERCPKNSGKVRGKKIGSAYCVPNNQQMLSWYWVPNNQHPSFQKLVLCTQHA